MKCLLPLMLIVFFFNNCSLFKDLKTDFKHNIPAKKMSLMLNDSLRIPSLKNKETGVLTFANLNNLNTTEPIGRYLQERLSYYLFNNGFRLKELRLGKQIRYIPKTGEINITRLKSELNEAGYGRLESIIIGTYIDTGKNYYVSVKLIELKNGLIRAIGEVTLEKGKYLDKLIGYAEKNKKLPETVYERTPIGIK